MIKKICVICNENEVAPSGTFKKEKDVCERCEKESPFNNRPSKIGFGNNNDRRNRNE